jgi:hypothetical protein
MKIKLKDLNKIIKQYINEGSIRIPKEMLDKISELYDFIAKNIDDIMSAIYPDKNDIDPVTKKPRTAFPKENPLTHPYLKNFFQFKGKYGKDVSVDVGLCGNDSSYAYIHFETSRVIINMDFWYTKSVTRGTSYSKSKRFFITTVNHELAHAVDPFTKHASFNKYEKQHSATPSDNYLKYAKSQHEYAAHLSSIVEELRPIVGNDNKKVYAAIKVISEIFALSPDDKEYLHSPGNNQIKEKYKNFISRNEYYELFDIAVKPEIWAWSKRPTLWKKFIKDLASSLLS